MKKKGFLFVISGPSNVGKTSVVNELLKQKKINLQRIITFTTRTKRNGEVEGQNQLIVSIEPVKNSKTRTILESIGAAVSNKIC